MPLPVYDHGPHEARSLRFSILHPTALIALAASPTSPVALDTLPRPLTPNPQSPHRAEKTRPPSQTGVSTDYERNVTKRMSVTGPRGPNLRFSEHLHERLQQEEAHHLKRLHRARLPRVLPLPAPLGRALSLAAGFDVPPPLRPDELGGGYSTGSDTPAEEILHSPSGLRPLWWSIPHRCCAPGHDALIETGIAPREGFRPSLCAHPGSGDRGPQPGPVKYFVSNTPRKDVWLGLRER